MNDTHTPAAKPTCQYCGHEVEWSRHAGYATFTHVENRSTECPTEK